MTNKRYSFNWERGHPNFWDNYCDYADCYLTCEDVCELLNELCEENRKLQRHIDVMRSGALTDDKRIKELYDENEQLKKSVKRQQSSNDECAKLIEEQQKENEQLKTQLKDCEKRLTDKELEWLRNNTVWEQIPSTRKTKTHLRPKRWKE